MGKNKLFQLDYNLNLLKSYERLCNLPGFVLLQSSDSARGRYDIVSACPYDQVVVDRHNVTESDVLRQMMDALPIAASDTDLPFQGGAIGYISYDFGAETSGTASPAQESLAAIPVLHFGLYDWAIITDHRLKKVTVFAANTQESTSGIIQEVMALWHSVCGYEDEFKVIDELQPLISKTAYCQAFDTIHATLKSGRAYQVNLTQPFSATYSGDAWGLYANIAASNPVPFSAFIRGNSADIVSFSPERFLRHDKGQLLASPIKGTVARSDDPKEDDRLKDILISCAKNRAENTMIVDLMRNDLGKIAKPGTVKVARLCVLESFNSVHHLVSDIEAQCQENMHPFAAFLACFPGGSISGAPKLEAMKIIQEQEPFARGVYCGSIGYFSRHGRFDTNIAIRTIVACNGRLHFASGGGIVIDSECEDEYSECFTKLAAITDGIY